MAVENPVVLAGSPNTLPGLPNAGDAPKPVVAVPPNDGGAPKPVGDPPNTGALPNPGDFCCACPNPPKPV